MKHTPGPWRIEDAEDPHPVFHTIVAGSYDAGNHVCVGSTWGGPHIGNATLIAAAPEMLAALKDILELFEDQEDIKDGAAGGQLPNDAMRACMIVRAAITKAEAAL